MKDLKIDPFSAPVPGESLTKPPGATPMEQPPQYTDPQEASEVIFSMLCEQRIQAQLIALLKAGVTCEAFTRTLLFGGFTGGKWTPDLALMLSHIVLAMVVAIAERARKNGFLKAFVIMNPDVQYIEFMRNISAMVKEENIPDAAIATTEKALEKKPLITKGILGGE